MKKIPLLLYFSIWFLVHCQPSDSETETNLLLVSILGIANGNQNPGTLAFASDRTGDDELYLLDLGENRLQRLTENPGRDLAPRWNLAGDKLLFNSRRSVEHGHSRPELYKMEFPNQSLERLTTTADPDENQRGAWFPNGEEIIFQRGTYFSPARLRFIRKNLVSGAETTLYENGNFLHAAPAVSLDGNLLVFQSNMDATGTFPSRLYLMDLRTMLVEPFAVPDVDLGSDLDPKWSTDGNYVVFSSARNGGGDYNHIFVIEVSTRTIRQITFGPYYDSAPEFSPQGKEIVFQSDRNVEDGIHIVNLDTGEVRFVGEGRTPVWSRKTLGELGF